MKIFKTLQNKLKTFFQNIFKIFQNKQPINNNPRGWVWLMLFHLHPLVINFINQDLIPCNIT
jgi:hypothetical protein